MSWAAGEAVGNGHPALGDANHDPALFVGAMRLLRLHGAAIHMVEIVETARNSYA